MIENGRIGRTVVALAVVDTVGQTECSALDVSPHVEFELLPVGLQEWIEGEGAPTHLIREVLDGNLATSASLGFRGSRSERGQKLHRVGLEVNGDDAAIAGAAKLLNQRGEAQRGLAGPTVAQEVGVFA